MAAEFVAGIMIAGAANSVLMRAEGYMLLCFGLLTFAVMAIGNRIAMALERRP